MKTSIKVLLLVVAFAFSSVMSANTEPTFKDPKSLTEEIQNLLKNPKMDLGFDAYAKVTLLFNKNAELVVMSVDSEYEELSDYIKGRLNYKKLNVSVDNLNKIYVVPVKIKQE